MTTTPLNPSLDEFVRFAVFKHPAVRAAYFDWRAAVNATAPARALPDPQFTFEADVARTLMTFMPGVMIFGTQPWRAKPDGAPSSTDHCTGLPSLSLTIK